VDLLSATIVHRDEANNGMSRNEVIALTMEMSQCSKRQTAENHFDHLVRTKRLRGVKNFGGTVAAQATTTKQSQMHIKQQLRWHTCVDEALSEMRRLNQPAAALAEVEDHFFGNLDETCLMANADGSVRVIASMTKKKTEKNVDDSRASIASLRAGMASGIQGPFAFLAKGTQSDRPSLKNTLKTQCPSGSAIVMSPAACMTNEVHPELVPGFCKGVRDMPVVRDHPDWWLTLTCDGFGSHLLDETQTMFSQCKIKMTKEEGDSSQVSQACDQTVARQDKACMRHNIQLARRPLGNKKIDQWSLIAIVVNAQPKVKPQDWQRSHQRVNTQPSTRVSFDVFIKQLDDRGVLISGEKFFSKRTSLIGAMPACWLKLSVEQRHEVLSIIKRVRQRAKDTQQPITWAKEGVIRLTGYVKMDEIYKLRACCPVAQKDPAAIVGTSAETQTTEAANQDAANEAANEATVVASELSGAKNIQDFFSVHPAKLMVSCKANRKDPDVQRKLFDHMTNCTAQSMWNSKKSLEPSSHLDVIVSDEQKELLCPSCKNCLMCFIMCDVKGKGAKTKMAKGRLDMITGNVSSCSRCLNDSKRPKMIEEANQLAATVAEATADMDAEKERKRVEAAQKVSDKKRKTQDDKAKDAVKRAAAMPSVQLVMDDFVKGAKQPAEFESLTRPVLANILKHFCNVKPKGLTKMSKEAVVEAVKQLFNVQPI